MKCSSLSVTCKSYTRFFSVCSWLTGEEVVICFWICKCGLSEPFTPVFNIDRSCSDHLRPEMFVPFMYFKLKTFHSLFQTKYESLFFYNTRLNVY